MEFKEGVHKSSLRKTMVEQEPEPGSGHQSNKRTRWFLALAVVLLVCIVGGGIISFQVLRNPRAIGPVTQVHPGWCSVPVTGLHTSVGVPLLKGIDAVSTRDIWMAGYLASPNDRTTSQTLIEHWNGTSLSVTPSPNVGENGDRLSLGCC